MLSMKWNRLGVLSRWGLFGVHDLPYHSDGFLSVCCEGGPVLTHGGVKIHDTPSREKGKRVLRWKWN